MARLRPAADPRRRGPGASLPSLSLRRQVAGASSSSPATEGQLRPGAATELAPSGLKLFSQVGGGAGRALSLCAGLAPPRVPRVLLGGTGAARRPGPPPARDLTVPPPTQEPPPTARPRAGEKLDPRAGECAPLPRAGGTAQEVGEAWSSERESESEAQVPAPSIRAAFGCARFRAC